MEDADVLAIMDLLTRTIGITEKYREINRRTGAKYNLFKIADIETKEKLICKVIADLLNPQGLHYKGDIYLKLFKENVLKDTEVKVYQELDTKQAVVGIEHFTDKGRKIDIVIERNIFIPIEAKINAPDLDNQISDYWKYAKKINKKDIPVLYLTKNGSKPGEKSVKDSEKYKYKCISFSKNILSWLDACLKCSETITTPSVRETIIQLIATIKSFCGIMEDENMEKEIFELITQDDNLIRAALAIISEVNGGCSGFHDRVLKTFKGAILALVQASFSNAKTPKDSDDPNWEYMEIPIREGDYLLQVNYDWTSVWLQATDSCKMDSAPQEWAKLNKKMTELFKFEGKPAPENRTVWEAEDLSWPSLESYAKNDNEKELYYAHLSKLSPQEVADRIIGIADELQKC